MKPCEEIEGIAAEIEGIGANIGMMANLFLENEMRTTQAEIGKVLFSVDEHCRRIYKRLIEISDAMGSAE